VAIVSGQSDGEGSCGGLFKDKYYYEAWIYGGKTLKLCYMWMESITSLNRLLRRCSFTRWSWLARFKSRGCARRRFMQVMESSTGWTLKRVATSIILFAWNVCHRIPGIWLARVNLYRVNAT
jgi:hypothetical protein